MTNITRIHLWSGPRNISTAMMYSFAQRSDTQVVDEPFYAHYLRVSGVAHPGREEVLAAQENDAGKVIAGILSDDFARPNVFFKQMTHHLVDIPEANLYRLLSAAGPGAARTLNIVLIRDPKDVLFSYAKVIERPVLQDIGIRQGYDLLKLLQQRHCHWVVMDSADVLENPKRMLTKLCEALGIPFEENMLHWKAGPRSEDGVWAKHWYTNVHRSTGFERPGNKTRPALRSDLAAIEAEARPYYEHLHSHALKAG